MRDKKFDLSAFGELLIDFTYQGVNEYGMKTFAQNAGGAPANVAVAGAKLGLKTAFLGKIGADLHGDFLCQTLEDCSVNTDGLVRSNEYFTTLAFVDIDKNGERSFSFARQHSADIMIESSEINTDIISNSKIFHIGSLSLTNEQNKAATYFAIEKAKEASVLISYDPNYRASLWTDENVAKIEMKKVVKYVDLMKISDEEILLITDESNVIKAGEKLISQGVKVVVITCGSNGCYLFFKNENHFVPSIKTEVVDTTGAGDAFCGGFLYKFLTFDKKIEEISMCELITSIEFATIVASKCIASQGAIPSMPYLEELE